MSEFTADILAFKPLATSQPPQPTGGDTGLAAPDAGFGPDIAAMGAAMGRDAKGAVIGAQDANPDAAGKASVLGARIGVPPAIVESDLGGYEKQAQISQASQVFDAHPKIAGWVANDPFHARVAKDDFEHLGVLGKLTTAITTGWDAAGLGNQRGRLGTQAQVGVDVSGQVADIDRRLGASPEVHGVYGYLQKAAGFAGGLLDNFMHGSLPAGTAGGIAGAAAGSAAGGIGAVPGAAAGAVLGAVVVGPALDMGKVAAGNTYLNLSQMKGHDGQPVSEPVKNVASVLVGLGTTALGMVGAKAVEKPALDAVGKFMGDAMAEAVTRPTVARALGNFATSLGKAGLTGAALNSAMEGTSIFGEEFAKQLSGGANFETVFNDPLARQTAVDHLITAATDGAMLFPLVHLPFAAGSLVGDTMRARQATADTAAFQALETGAVGSKTRERSLDAFQSFMRSQTDGTPVENIGLTGDAVRTLYQSHGVEPGPGDGLLGDLVPDLAKQMQQAGETGGDIIVPTAAYVAHLSGTPISESLRAEIRFRPDGMTMREAGEYEKQRGELLADLATQGRASADAEAAAADPVRQVYENMLGQLRAAGQTVEQATQTARLVSERYAARAERLGGEKSALDLYRAEGITVQKAVSEGLRNALTDESDLVINALRNENRKAPKTRDLFGPSLHEAVRAMGGIVDTGGELRAMDLHKTKGLIRKAGEDKQENIDHGADNVARAMWDAGYFPELTERPTPDQLFDAMRRGDERYSQGAGDERKAAFEEAVKDLDEFTARAGIDVKKATNAEIKAALQKHIDEEMARAAKTFEQGERGRLDLNDGRSIITLFKDADASTALHEFGHQWLEEMGRDAAAKDAPEGLRADAAAIAKYLGADDLSALTTDQHETFARSFETYLMEGRAPSSALASAFRKFKSWLTRIYKTVAALRVPINDEIRGVFDRMVASDEAIESWRNTENLRPVFATAKDGGMTDAEFTAYSKGIERSRTQADEKMLAKTMAAIRASRTKEWKEEAAGVREDVASTVRSRPDLRAQYWLRTGKVLDDPESVASPDRARLSKDTLADMYGTDEASKALPSGVVQAEGGAHPDEVAEMFGYRSGDELVRALMTLESAKRQVEETTGKTLDGNKYVNHLIDSQTRDIMLERHGDALNDGSIEADALEAVHNRAQADVMAMETRAIAKQAGLTALRLADIEAWADGQLEGMSTKRATDMAGFARLEAKFGREAQRALLKGKLEEAFQAKQKQLINHVLTRKAGEAAEQVAKDTALLKKLGKTPKRETVQQGFMDQIHTIVERMGIATKAAPEDLAATPSLNKFVSDQAAIGQDVFMPDVLLNERWRGDVDNMKLAEFQDAMDGVKSLLNLGRKMRGMEIEGDNIRYADMVQQMRDQAGAEAVPSQAGMQGPVGKIDKIKDFSMGTKAALRRVESWARLMDGGKVDGPFTKYLVRPIYEALDRYHPARVEYMAKLWDIIEPHRKELGAGKIYSPELNYTFEDKGALLHAILHSGNDSNFRKLLLGREWGTLDKDGNLDDSRWRSAINRLAQNGTLKKEHFDTAQKIWNLLEELKPGAQDAHKSIYGVRFNEITRRPTWTPFGDVDGGYMPAIVDRFIVRDHAQKYDVDALREQQTGGMFPSTGRGFTKSRVDNYNKALELNLSRIPSHIDSVLKFTHLQPTIRDVGRLLLKRNFKDMMAGINPHAIDEMLMPYLQRTATQTLTIPATTKVGRMWAKVLNSARRRSSMQVLAFNVANSVQQIVGLSPAIQRTSKGSMARSLMSYVMNPGKTADAIAEKSPYMDRRLRNKSADLMLEIEHAIKSDTILGDMQEWGARNGSIFQHMFQNIVDITTWNAAHDVASRGNMTEAEAIQHADEVVRSTQGGFGPEDLSKFETGSALSKLMVSNFYSYWGSQNNYLATEFGLTKDMHGAKAVSARAAIALYGIVIPAVLSDLIYRGATGNTDDDNDPATAWGDASYYLGAVGRYAAGMVPVFGAPAVALFDKSSGDRIGSSPTVSIAKKAVRVPGEVMSAASGDAGWGPVVRDGMTALGFALHLPLGQAGKTAGYITDVATGRAEPDDLKDLQRGLVTGSQKKYP